MKKLFITLGVLLIAQMGFAQEKPIIVQTKPSASQYFFSNPATKPDKVSKDNPVVLTQFNVTIPQDQEIFARTGSGKLSEEDARLLLKFHISNLDKLRFQKATDELATYLLDQLKAQGFKIGAYTDFSSGSKYPGIEIKPDPKGEKPDLYGPGFTVPGEIKLVDKAIMFSAFGQPLYPLQSMKVGYIMMEKKINILTFGMILNFMEFETETKYYNNSTNLTMKFNGQLYASPSFTIQSPVLSSISIQPANKKETINSYSFGREFTTSINKENGDVMIDNDKFIAAYTELGKSYIDNMIEAMNTPTKK